MTKQTVQSINTQSQVKMLFIAADASRKRCWMMWFCERKQSNKRSHLIFSYFNIMYSVKCICQQVRNYLFICHVWNKSKPTVDSLHRHFDLVNFVFLFWNSKEKLLNCGVQHFHQGGQPSWPEREHLIDARFRCQREIPRRKPVCPVDEEKVYWNPTEYETKPNSNHLQILHILR